MTASIMLAAPTALAVYDAALRRAAAGHPAGLVLRDGLGVDHHIDVAAWCRPHLPGDAELLDRCRGATLDLGCGPGRLIAALSPRGGAVLGVDLSPTAVRLARLRGATALRRDIFDQLPGVGGWSCVLLADGNIGIAGDPVGLLRRCRPLLSHSGLIHVELAAPGTRRWSGVASLRTVGDDPHRAAPLRWASVPIDHLATVAARAALRTVATWTEAGRWFASLTRT